ncbi:ABC transporter ATP-binding protein [Achromobacter sp. GG226]|uniref:ABC transporter ATP-binding protein n=1 Tax=Verticiella alkaliphila TaxID=2779529 RepID=UPI001C0DEAED|nr:ABC transporter ATP-binding protein [Verticiella sp. GG226]MBU4609313.1 ABC transporter ATP-binding protein [Verticiella sp. GG226]
MPERDPVLRLSGVRKSFNVGRPNEAEVLHGIDLTLPRGDFAALIGPSGSGKSTLLNLIAQLDAPTAGEILLDGHATRTLDDTARTALRRRTLGFVFQFHHLIPAFTALENVLMPLMIAGGRPDAAARDRAQALLHEVGLGEHAGKRPTELSGGQQQRVAVARALVHRPLLVVADEPTGNLDTQTADTVFDLFRRVHDREGCAVLVVTHDARLAETCDRRIRLVDGFIVEDTALHHTQNQSS